MSIEFVLFRTLDAKYVISVFWTVECVCTQTYLNLDLNISNAILFYKYFAKPIYILDVFVASSFDKATGLDG